MESAATGSSDIAGENNVYKVWSGRQTETIRNTLTVTKLHVVNVEMQYKVQY